MTCHSFIELTSSDPGFESPPRTKTEARSGCQEMASGVPLRKPPSLSHPNVDGAQALPVHSLWKSAPSRPRTYKLKRFGPREAAATSGSLTKHEATFVTHDADIVRD